MSGWIKLHRSLLEWEWYDDINATRVLIHLLLSVNYEDKKWKGILVPAGSLVFSYDSLSRKVNLSVQQLRTSLKKIESSGEITRKATSKYQVVSLVKWDKLQSSKPDINKEDNKELTDEQQGSNKQSTTTKETNNKTTKETKKIFNFFNSLIDFGANKQLAQDWIKVRKNKKATNSQTAFNSFAKQLEKSNLDINSVLEECVINSWSGFKSEWLTNKQPQSNTNTSNKKLTASEALKQSMGL